MQRTNLLAFDARLANVVAPSRTVAPITSRTCISHSDSMQNSRGGETETDSVALIVVIAVIFLALDE